MLSKCTSFKVGSRMVGVPCSLPDPRPRLYPLSLSSHFISDFPPPEQNNNKSLSLSGRINPPGWREELSVCGRAIKAEGEMHFNFLFFPASDRGGGGGGGGNSI